MMSLSNQRSLSQKVAQTWKGYVIFHALLLLLYIFHVDIINHQFGIFSPNKWGMDETVDHENGHLKVHYMIHSLIIDLHLC